MTKNNDNNSVETPKKTSKHGFQKGGIGGPGRPKLSDADRSDLADVERTIQEGMRAKYPMTDRIKAAGLGLKLKAMKSKKPEEITTPWVLKLASLLTDLAAKCSEEGIPVNGVSVVDRMARVCPTCPLLKGTPTVENF
jgi:hypothetical protein